MMKKPSRKIDAALKAKIALEAPEEGAIVFADGNNWNPGQGRGFYGFERGAWRKL